ncbi:MAG: glycosyltransferase, partial [Cyanobacteriota bacterium]
GDLNPYLGMGRVLKKNGYEVVLCTHANYREPVEKLGLKFVELKPSLEELGPEDEWSNHVNHPRTGIEFILKKILSPYIKHNYEIILKE